VQERMLSYLPLSHVAGMMLDIVCPVYLTARSEAAHLTTFFARVYDLKAGSLKDRLQVATPTLFLGVPLVWEKIADRIRALGAETTGLKKKIATWAKSCGLEHAQNCQLGGTGTKPFGYGLADALVLSKIKANLGLQHLKFGMTGAAPIRADTLEYFGQLGIEINEVYGMSESCGLASVSSHQAHLWGSCGYALPGVELKAFTVNPDDLNVKEECAKAADLQSGDAFQGELCWRSRGNMMGYMAQPDLGEDHVAEIQAKTAEAIDKDGFLHSGDKGMILETGMCKITGRYKEIIIGEGGENIAPVPIEDHVKKTCDGIAEIMMVGDKRKYNVALVTLKAVGANGEVPGSDDLDAGAKRVNAAVQTISGAIEDPVWIEAVQAAITSVNTSHHCTNQAFKIQKFMILPSNFSELGNELTPTKKLKRAVVAAKYAKAIDALYESSGSYVKYSVEVAP
jgi:long-chain-fatty-acid--CoA ligase ACSBG